MHGDFFWYDLMTSDTKAAAKFYGDVLGWGTQPQGDNYTAFALGGRGVAGLMPIPEDYVKMGGGPAWMGYILVDDVDKSAKLLVKEGGKLHRGPTTVPGIIRFAVVADPQGAGFLIATPLMKEAPPPIAPDAPGNISWRELYAGDWKKVSGFYEKLFGWKKGEAHDMGAMGTYQLFKTPGSAVPAGGMMTKPPALPRPFWTYYFNVALMDAAVGRLTHGGGKVLMGPHQVPGGLWIVQATDPQGANFALIAPQR